MLDELRPGLRRWTARHPDAEADPEPGCPVWLDEHRALVPGDRLLRDGAGSVRLCPPSWLRYLESGMTTGGPRAALAPLRDLPVEMVLVSHGEPVLRDGAAAIARAQGART